MQIFVAFLYYVFFIFSSYKMVIFFVLRSYLSIGKHIAVFSVRAANSIY